MILWWGSWSLHHFSLYHSLCLKTSRLRHRYTRIRESILNISLNSRLSRAIRQSPYQSRVIVVTSRCVYMLSIIQLLIWIFIYMCLITFYLLLHCNRISLRAYFFLFYIDDHDAISLTYFIFNYQIAFL